MDTYISIKLETPYILYNQDLTSIQVTWFCSKDHRAKTSHSCTSNDQEDQVNNNYNEQYDISPLCIILL